MEDIIAIDFDGTCVTHEYPLVGKDVPNAVNVLKKLNACNIKLILWTMRSGDKLIDAKNWFREREIELWGINENPTQKVWTDSPKAYAKLYIDDAALGCPLSYIVDRPYVDWYRVETILKSKQVIFDI